MQRAPPPAASRLECSEPNGLSLSVRMRQVGKLGCPALLCSGGLRSGPLCHGRGAALPAMAAERPSLPWLQSAGAAYLAMVSLSCLCLSWIVGGLMGRC